MRILVTGGAGYLGAHTVVALVGAGHDVVVVDDLSSGSPEAVSRAELVTGARIPLHAVDVADIDALERIFDTERIEAVVHLVGRRADDAQTQGSLDHYEAVLGSTFTLLRCMAWYRVNLLVAASSAAVYGTGVVLPAGEAADVAPASPAGRAARMTEQVLHDVARSRPELRVGVLRCFTAAGAHRSGTLGEPPGTGLLTTIGQVALGLRERLEVHGADHPTPDGTPMRDLVHVEDQATAFVAALSAAAESERRFSVWNVGTGRPTSVLELVRAFESATGRRVPYRFVPRRDDGVSVRYADPALAEDELGWSATRSLADICTDHWRWLMRNPTGYPGVVGVGRPWRGGVGHRLRLASPAPVLRDTGRR